MKQVRFIPNADCGLKVREPMEGQSESRRIEGRPVIFGVRSINLTPWSSSRKVYEILEPGCISNELLQRSDVILNINHSNKVTDVLGRCNNGRGTLSLGLRGIPQKYVEAGCDLPQTNTGNDTLELIKRGDISGMSFAFEDDWEDTENGVSLERTDEIEDGKEVWLRHVKRITALYDVSIVTHPAYEQTTVAVREQGDAILRQIDEQIEKQQRACGGEGNPKQDECGGETEEEKAKREEAEREANGGETNAEKEAREQAEREANGGETNAEKQAREERELEEQNQRFRQQRAMRMRAHRLRTAEELESF